MRAFSIGVSLVVLSLGIPQTVAADPIFGVRANTYLRIANPDNPTFALDDAYIGATTLGVDTIEPVDRSLSYEPLGATASTFASIVDGVLSATASVSTVFPDAYGSARANLTFFDTLTLTSSTLANGTAVQLVASLLATGPDGDPCTCDDAGMRAYANIGDLGIDQFGSVILTAFIGQELVLESGLGMFLEGTGASIPMTSVQLVLNPMASNFSYSTASGNDYRGRQSVPEPGTLLLSLIAVGLGVCGRRSRLHRTRPFSGQRMKEQVDQ